MLLPVAIRSPVSSSRWKLARARISPVPGRDTIAMPPRASLASIWSRRARSVSYRIGDVVGHASGDVGELGVVLGPVQAGRQGGGAGSVEGQRAGQRGGHLQRVGDLLRVGPDGPLGEAHREVVPVPVEDRAAIAGE